MSAYATVEVLACVRCEEARIDRAARGAWLMRTYLHHLPLVWKSVHNLVAIAFLLLVAFFPLSGEIAGTQYAIRVCLVCVGLSFQVVLYHVYRIVDDNMPARRLPPEPNASVATVPPSTDAVALG